MLVKHTIQCPIEPDMSFQLQHDQVTGHDYLECSIRPYKFIQLMINNFPEYFKGIKPRITSVTEVVKLGQLHKETMRFLVNYFLDGGKLIEIEESEQ